MGERQPALIIDKNTLPVRTSVSQSANEFFDRGALDLLTVQLPDSSNPAHDLVRRTARLPDIVDEGKIALEISFGRPTLPICTIPRNSKLGAVGWVVQQPVHGLHQFLFLEYTSPPP